MFNGIRTKFSSKLSIDLGTSNSVVVKDRKVRVSQPTMLAFHKRAKKMYFGTEAQRMALYADDQVEPYWPMAEGKMKDPDQIESYLKFLVSSANSTSLIKNAKVGEVAIAVPSQLDSVHKNAIRTSAERIASRVWLIEQPVAAAFGEGLYLPDMREIKVLDVGGGTTDWAVISKNGVIRGGSSSTNIAGNHMDLAIQTWIKNKFNGLKLSLLQCRQIKETIGSAPSDSRTRCHVDFQAYNAEGFTVPITLTDEDMMQALAASTRAIADFARASLGDLSVLNPDATTKLKDGWFDGGRLQAEEDKILFTGGQSLMNRFAEYLERELQIPILKAKQPLEAAALGAWLCLENPALMKAYHVNDKVWDSCHEVLQFTPRDRSVSSELVTTTQPKPAVLLDSHTAVS